MTSLCPPSQSSTPSPVPTSQSRPKVAPLFRGFSLSAVPVPRRQTSGQSSWATQLLKATEAELSTYTAPEGAGSLRSRAGIAQEDEAPMQAQDYRWGDPSRAALMSLRHCVVLCSGQRLTVLRAVARAITALFTAGELALLPGAKVPDRLIVATQVRQPLHLAAWLAC